MYLSYYLEQLSPSILSKIMDEYGLITTNKAPNQLVAQLNQHLLQVPNIAEQYQQMIKEEKEVIRYFIFQLPNQMLLYRKLDQFNGNLTRDEFEYGITKLRRKGILFTLRKTWGEVGYILPENLYQAWHKFFFSSIINNQEELKYTIGFIEQPLGLIEDDLFRLLVYIKHEEIPVTLKGTIHKRHITKLDELIKIKNEQIEKFPFRNNFFSKEYPKNIALLLEIASMVELITTIHKVKTTRKAVIWHELDQFQRREYLESIIRYLFKSTDLLIQHLYYIIFHFPKGKWFSFNNLLKDLAGFLNRQIDDLFLKRVEDEIIKPLLALGWIQVSRNDSETMFLWLEFDENNTNQIYIQPNYEILVPQFFPYHLRFVIEQFADLDNQDKVNRYKLTKESVLRGLENGGTIEDFFDFISKYSLTPMSDNVESTLRGWAENYGTISFMDVRLLKCESEEIAKSLKDKDKLKEWIIGEIAPTHLIIKREGFEELISLLKEMEFQPIKEIWNGVFEENFDEDADIELIRNKDYQVENIFPAFTKRMFND